MIFSSCNALKCNSMSNQENKVRPVIINIDSDKASFYSYNILANTCSGICNNINDLYAKLCVPGVVKNINVKGFNLVSKNNETPSYRME